MTLPPFSLLIAALFSSSFAIAQTQSQPKSQPTNAKDKTAAELAAVLSPRFLPKGRKTAVRFRAKGAAAAFITSAKKEGSPCRFVDATGTEVDVSQLTPAEITKREIFIQTSVHPELAIEDHEILFQKNSSQPLGPASYRAIRKLAKTLNAPQMKGQKFLLQGHASAEGDPLHNLALSKKRAEVLAQLIKAQLDHEVTLHPIGCGSDLAQHPSGASEALRALDRRAILQRL